MARHGPFPPPSIMRRLVRDRGGIAGIEFALVFPLLLLIAASCVDISEALAAQRKTAGIAASLAGFLADENEWTKSEVDELLGAGRFIMSPFDAADLRIVLSVLQVSKDGSAKVVASRGAGAPPLALGSVLPGVVPREILAPDTNLVLAEVDYSLVTPFSGLWPVIAVEGRYELSASHFARPRQGTSISIR